jgi:predicted DNA-binding transcriptional regulator YafY
MTHSEATPGALAVRMSVSDRTVRRMAEAYEEVYGRLPRNQRGHRLFPAEAVARLEDGLPLLRAHPGASLEQVLTAQRDGHPMQPTARPAADLAPVLEELHALRSEVAELRALLLTLASGARPALGAPDSPAADLIAPIPAAAVKSTRRRSLQPNHAELLERMRAGSTVVEQGSRRLEVRPDGGTDRVDPRTLDALVRYGMVKRDPDGVYRTTDTPLLMP